LKYSSKSITNAINGPTTNQGHGLYNQLTIYKFRIKQIYNLLSFTNDKAILFSIVFEMF
jgi:hypothetical protein